MNLASFESPEVRIEFFSDNDKPDTYYLEFFDQTHANGGGWKFKDKALGFMEFLGLVGVYTEGMVSG